MGALNHIPQLAIPEQQQEDPLDRYSKLVGIQHLAAQGELQQQKLKNDQLQNQADTIKVAQAQRDQQDDQIKNQAFHDSGGDPQKFVQLLQQNGASFKAVQGVNQGLTATREALGKADAETFTAHQKANELIGQNIQSIANAAPEDQAAQYTLVTNAMKRDPNLQKYLPPNLPPQYPGPDALKSAMIGVGMNDALMKQAKEDRESKLAGPQLTKATADAATAQSEQTVKGAEAAAVTQGGAIPGVPLENQEANSWLAKNPGKDLADFQKYKAGLVPAINFNLNNAAGGGLKDAALDQAAERYATTGQLPPAGRGAAGIAQNRTIMNRAAELHPTGNLAENSAEYAANKSSLAGLQKNFDQVSAFENTAGKNLDLFLKTAQPIVDSGSPWINKPLRAIAQGALGSADQVAFNAARQTAVTEIAKVLNSSNASGVLSDSARGEVQSMIGPDATMKQIVGAANILKQDMANRHQAYQEQINDIKSRGVKAGDNSTQSAPPKSTGGYVPPGAVKLQ